MNAEFWNRLREYRSDNVFNPWGDSDPLDLPFASPIERAERLASHFDVDAKYLLIGEAPGYRGCHFSGIPFTCEKQLIKGEVPRVKATKRLTNREIPFSEGSATVIWGTLHALGIADRTVMWNAYPFHPHKPGHLMSNRTPSPSEVRDGQLLLAMVLERFAGAQVIAIGLVALRALHGFGCASVRHPSMGGANKFRAQMRELAA